MSVLPPRELEAMNEDPDDYRPGSRWAVIADPGAPQGRVDDLSIIQEMVAPGDRIPLHRHRVNEAVLIVSGEAEVTLGTESLRPAAGSTVFVPAGMKHAHKNVGAEPLHIIAICPSSEVDMEMLERNPAPGTENDAPKHTTYDMRTGKFWSEPP